MPPASGYIMNFKGTSKNSDFFVSARKHRTENRSVYSIHEDSSTELTPQSRKKTIFRGALKPLVRVILFNVMMILLAACSDEAKEADLVNLYAMANQDVISIQFPSTTEDVVSINSLSAFSVQGIKSNGVDSITLSNQIEWSLSDGATSTIDQQGYLTAGPSAETISIIARLGILSTSIDIRVSDAVFDQVIRLDNDPVSLEMCQSQTITPIGRYIGTLGDEERKVDNTIIGNIQWSILSAADNSPSQSAYIKTVGNTTILYGLAPAALIIQAQQTGNPAIANLNQTIGNGLSSIKICNSSATDYTSCNTTSRSVEQGNEISFIAVGQYAAGGYQNISRTSKWGISNSNMTGALSSNLQQLDISAGVVPDEDTSTSSTLSVACGDINQSLPADITQGIVLNQTVECTSNCQGATAAVTINQLSVTALKVTVNGSDNELTHSTTFNLDAPRPDEIALEVSATYSNSSNPVVITDNTSLSYEINDLNGNKVIEAKANTPGTFTVLNAGEAQIIIKYRNASFTARINIP